MQPWAYLVISEPTHACRDRGLPLSKAPEVLLLARVHPVAPAISLQLPHERAQILSSTRFSSVRWQAPSSLGDSPMHS